MHWSGDILGGCDRREKPYPPCRPWWRAAGLRDWSVMNARKTSGFLVVAPSRLAEAKCRTETRCGNDRQLAGCAASFLTELCQPLGCNMNPERSCCPMVGGGGAWPCRQLYPSHPPCAGLCDLASVSLTVRSFSKSLRRTPPPVSTNVRWKPSLIARRGVHHCAPLHLACLPYHHGS